MLITDIRPGEPDLIAGHELARFEVRTLDGVVLDSAPATEPWTHAKLVNFVDARQNLIQEAGAANFYLGGQFVGSTEV